MKTIKVTDEMYDFLIKLSTELNSQNHRMTQMPYFFQIREDKVVAASEGEGDEVWHQDGCFLDDEDAIKVAIMEYKEWDLQSKEDDAKYNELDELDKEAILEQNYQKVNIKKVHEFHNAFFTEKAVKQHIKLNHYHYNNPTDYLQYAYRNPEMEKVMQFLCELTGGSLHK